MPLELMAWHFDLCSRCGVLVDDDGYCPVHGEVLVRSEIHWELAEGQPDALEGEWL